MRDEEIDGALRGARTRAARCSRAQAPRRWRSAPAACSPPAGATMTGRGGRRQPGIDGRSRPASPRRAASCGSAYRPAPTRRRRTRTRRTPTPSWPGRRTSMSRSPSTWPDGTFGLVLAESFEATNPSEWVVRLKPDVEFHNGKTVTADDLIFSIKRIVDPDTASRGGGGLAIGRPQGPEEARRPHGADPAHRAQLRLRRRVRPVLQRHRPDRLRPQEPGRHRAVQGRHVHRRPAGDAAALRELPRHRRASPTRSRSPSWPTRARASTRCSAARSTRSPRCRARRSRRSSPTRR